MKKPPRQKTGQKVMVNQITGSCLINKYITLPIVFGTTAEALVEITVDAYIVKGMTVPFVLGNDFAGQYQLSLIREDDLSYISFGKTDHRTTVKESKSRPRTDDSGNVFHVSAVPDSRSNQSRRTQKKLMRKIKQDQKLIPEGTTPVYTRKEVQLKPESLTKVEVDVLFPEGQTEGFIEKIMLTHEAERNLHGIADCIISVNSRFVQIANFSRKYLKVPKGTLIGYMRGVDCLKTNAEITDEELKLGQAKVAFVRARMKSDPLPSLTEEEEMLSIPVEGGPKTSELPDYDHVPKDKLLSEIKFSEALSPEQRSQLEKIVLKHHKAFGIDGRLGSYPAEVEIKLREGAKEISLTPYSASPAKREVIDKQINDWVRLGVIKQSKSPWAASLLVVLLWNQLNGNRYYLNNY